MARTINSPGVEIKEYDYSERATLQAGTIVLVQGFASQGPTNEVIQITSAEELNEIYFGGLGPTNPAERYFYHACMQVMRSPAVLQTIRLPYGSDAGTDFNGDRIAICLYGKPKYELNPYDDSDSWSLIDTNVYYKHIDDGTKEGYDLAYYKGFIQNIYHFANRLDNIKNMKFTWKRINDLSKEQLDALFRLPEGMKDEDPDLSGTFEFTRDLDALYKNFRYDANLRRLVPGFSDTPAYYDGDVYVGPDTIEALVDHFKKFTKKFYEFYADDELTITQARPYVLTEKDYQDIKLGALDHYDIMAITGELSPTLENMVSMDVGGDETRAPGRTEGLQIVIINRLRTSVDENLQGFYVAINDNYPNYLWELDGSDDEVSGNDTVASAEWVDPRELVFDDDIWYLTRPESEATYDEDEETDASGGRAGLNSINEGLWNFGRKKLAKMILNKPGEMFGNDDFRSCLGISTLRMVHDATSSNPDGLDCSFVAYGNGSLNANATHVDRSGYGRTSFFIDKYLPMRNPYIEVLTMKSAQRVTKVRFDFDPTLDPANHLGRAGKHGFIVSLGVARTCEQEADNRFVGNIPKKIANALSLIDNPMNEDLDIVIDGGLSTIWTYCSVKGICWDGAMHRKNKKISERETREEIWQGGPGAGDCEYDDTVYVSDKFVTVENDLIPCLKNHGGDQDSESPLYLGWFDVWEKFNTFVKDTRKDCVFISDPLRCIFVRGQGTECEELVGYTFTTHVAKTMKALYDGRNSNYACTYANWAAVHDDSASMDIWLPPSIFVAPIMCNVDAQYWPWYAPFGLNYGLLSTVKDIACRPNQQQCDTLYKMGVNMFVFFHGDGFVVWGQKTLQYKQSAFDRINVRRLFLYLERATVKCVRYYIGEPNTVFTRSRVVSALNPIFSTCKANSGCYDYRIICDESNNTPDTIDNNELIIDIYIKPVRIAEFILVNFYATKTSMDFSELM